MTISWRTMEAKSTAKTKTIFIPIKGVRNFASVVIPSEEELARIESGSQENQSTRTQIQTDSISKGKSTMYLAMLG